MMSVVEGRLRMGERGVLVIVAAPSGGGKTTLIRELRGILESEGRKTYFAVSHTTRRPRSGEQSGREYHFVTDAEFRAMVQAGGFLEYAHVHDRLYGTARVEVENRLERGWDVFLDIDVQGARQVKEKIPESLLIFVFPPSYAEVHRRLVARGQDSTEQIVVRMRNALNEMREYPWFDCVIINDCLEEAVREFHTAVAAARFRPAARRELAGEIIEDFCRNLEGK